jgi:hypothetical protein
MVKMARLGQKVGTERKQHLAFCADFLPCVEVQAVQATARADGFRERQGAAHAQTMVPALGARSLYPAWPRQAVVRCRARL